jgi:hypothetical protein
MSIGGGSERFGSMPLTVGLDLFSYEIADWPAGGAMTPSALMR